MTSEVLNIGKLMREEAKARNTRTMKIKKKSFMVSKEAVQEMRSYLVALLDKKMGIAVEIASKDKRMTVSEKDIVQTNSFKED